MTKRAKVCFVRGLSRWMSFLLATVLIGLPTMGFALDNTQTENDRDWELMVGVGAMTAPAYPGSDDMVLTPFPAILASYNPGFLRLFIEFNELGAEATINSILQVSLTAGVGLGDFERDYDDDGVPAGSSSIKNGVRFFGQLIVSMPLSIGIGGRATYYPITASYADAGRKDEKHSGMTFEVFLEREWMLFPLIFSISGGCTWMGREYAETVYGVEYAAGDLSIYAASAGLHDLYLTANLMMFFMDHIGIGTMIDCEYLLGDAADSPYASRAFQPTVGAYIVYRF